MSGNLLDHLVAEDLVLVENLDGDAVAGLHVAGVLDLGKASLAEGPPELVLPHPRPRRYPSSSDAAASVAHLSSFSFALLFFLLHPTYQWR